MSFWHDADEGHESLEPVIKKASSLTDLTSISELYPPIEKSETDGILTGATDNGDILGERISNILHRTYFTEQEKMLRGEPVTHPVLNADIRREGSHTLVTGELSNDDQAEWDDYFDIIMDQLPDAEEDFLVGSPLVDDLLLGTPSTYAAAPNSDDVLSTERSAKGGNVFGSMNWDTSLEGTADTAAAAANTLSAGFEEGHSDTPCRTAPREIFKSIEDTTDSEPNDDFDHPKKSLLIFTYAKPFLGDDLSQYKGTNFTSDMFKNNLEEETRADSLVRVKSLSQIDKHRSVRPHAFMLPMPQSSTGDLQGLFSSITPHAWILPYVVAGAVILSDRRRDTPQHPSKVSLMDWSGSRALVDDDLRHLRVQPPPLPPLAPTGEPTASRDDIIVNVSPKKISSSLLKGAPTPRRRRSQSIDLPSPTPSPAAHHSNEDTGAHVDSHTAAMKRHPQGEEGEGQRGTGRSGHRMFNFGRKRDDDSSLDETHYGDEDRVGMGSSPENSDSAPELSSGRSGHRMFNFGRKRDDAGSLDETHYGDEDRVGMGSSPGVSMGDGLETSPPLGASPPVGLLSGLINRMRSQEATEREVHGDLVLSHDVHGVYLTSKPEHSSSESALPIRQKKSKSCKQISQADSQTSLPKFMQHLFVFPNFVKLGAVCMCKANSVALSGEWEKRRIFLWDNYVFETLPDDDGIPIGFVNMSGAIVRMKTDLSSGVGMSQPLERVIRIVFYSSSDVLSPREEVFMKGKSAAATDVIYEKMCSAAKMDASDLYDYSSSDSSVLGTGRYSTVHRAVNKHLREKVLASDSEGESTPSSSVGASPLNKSSHLFSRHRSQPEADSKEEDATRDDSTVRAAESQSSVSAAGECALKLVKKQDFWKQVQTGEERKDTLVREVLAQSYLLNSIVSCGPSSAHLDELSLHEMELPIVQINGVFESRNNFVIDMELMQSTDLFETLCERGRGFKEQQVKHVAMQLVQAVAMLEANDISHRDIKLSNITFPEKMNEWLATSPRGRAKNKPMQIKLADFGMAGFVEKDGFLRGRCGTPGYVAPEIFRSGKREGYSLNVDMYSVGVCLYSLLCGYEPFVGDNIEEIIDANKSNIYDFDTPEWEKVSDDAKDFVRKAMNAMPENRLTVHEALVHPWMEQYGGTINYPPEFNHTKQHKGCEVS